MADEFHAICVSFESLAGIYEHVVHSNFNMDRLSERSKREYSDGLTFVTTSITAASKFDNISDSVLLYT